MDKIKGTDWITKFLEVQSAESSCGRLKSVSGRELVEFIEKESNGIFIFDKDSDCLAQNADVDWSYIYDIVKANTGYGFGNIVRQPLSPNFFINYDTEDIEPDMMYAEYDKAIDAVRLYIHTGNERTISEDSGLSEPNKSESSVVNDNDFHVKVINLSSRPVIEYEFVEGVRDRDGNWLEELHLVWE